MSNNALLHKLEQPVKEKGYGLALMVDPFLTQSSDEKSRLVTGEATFIAPSLYEKYYLNEQLDYGFEFLPTLSVFLLYRPYKTDNLFPEFYSLTKASLFLLPFVAVIWGFSFEQKIALSIKPVKWLSLKAGASVRIWTGDATVGTEYLAPLSSETINPYGKGAFLTYGPLLSLDIHFNSSWIKRINISLDWFMYKNIGKLYGPGLDQKQFLPQDKYILNIGVSF